MNDAPTDVQPDERSLPPYVETFAAFYANLGLAGSAPSTRLRRCVLGSEGVTR